LLYIHFYFIGALRVEPFKKIYRNFTIPLMFPPYMYVNNNYIYEFKAMFFFMRITSDIFDHIKHYREIIFIHYILLLSLSLSLSIYIYIYIYIYEFFKKIIKCLLLFPYLYLYTIQALHKKLIFPIFI